LRLTGICKRFGATRALEQVDLAVLPGQVHALIGENGAGKSTLMKILSGALAADRGTIELAGRRRTIGSPAAGRRLGIAMIYQELNLARHVSVEENVTLGMEKHRLGFVRRQRDAITRILRLLGHPEIPLAARVGSLGIGQQQIVEIARALFTDAKILIMDEPTSSLSGADARALFQAIRRLKQSAISVIYISHFLEEVFQIADAYSVLRDGRMVGTGVIPETTISQIIRMMVGRTLTEMFPKSRHEAGDSLIRVEGIQGSPLPRGVSLELRRGEVLGIAGLVGAGRSETVRRIFGLDRAVAGTLVRSGRPPTPLARLRPDKALAAKMNLLSENRKEEGLATNMTLISNVTLSCLPRFAGLGGWGFLNLRREGLATRRWIEELGIRCRGGDQLVGDLSGGNQQKVAIARILEQQSDVILLDEPTRGVDVGSKIDIYRLIDRLAAQGKGIVFVSSYLPELLGVCDTLAVMHRGRLSAVRPAGQWSEEEVMRVATSGE
jgi:ribose transport system ATP-binding protein